MMYREVSENIYGKWFPEKKIPQDLRNLGCKYDGVIERKGNKYCQRCGTRLDKSWKFPGDNWYCRKCIVFGRLSTVEGLIHFPQQNFEKQVSLAWKGRLTANQAQISNMLLENWKKKQSVLVHAVTGAGKTEMIYPLVSSVIDDGGVVCVASPRIDVCLELERRLSKDFRCSINLMYGGSEKECISPLTIATTHQLLKFYHAFDLLIIDEVDSFPYVDNQMLYYASKNAVKENGYRVFLTATSTDELDYRVKSGEIVKLSLPKRFHENPLVIPKTVWLSGLDKKIKKKKLPLKLLKQISKQLRTNFPLLIFYPTIKEGEEFTKILKCYFPSVEIAFISSQSEERKEITRQFRNNEIRILVSTTILERGVTFPCVDVYVIDAHHVLFNRSSLVQISGRVGRSKERPTGELIFYHEGLTKAIIKAKKEIRQMNKLGGF